MGNPLIGMSGGATYAARQTTTSNGGPQVLGMPYVVDGTPVRVAALGIAAGLALVALRWGGFRFNIGVSN